MSEQISEKTDGKLKDLEPIKKTANIFLIFSTCIVNLSTFGIGSAFAWTSPVLPQLESNSTADLAHNPLGYAISQSEKSLVTATFLITTAAGPFVATFISDKIGRKRSLMILMAPMIVGFILKAFATNILLYYVARLLCGISAGSVYAIMPIYVGEIAEDHNRGALGGLFSLFSTCGTLFAYSLGPYVSIRTFSLACSIPPIIFFVIFKSCIPESPYFLIGAGKQSEARDSLRRFRNCSDEALEIELNRIGRTVEEAYATKAIFKDILKSRGLRKGLLVNTALGVFQMLSGNFVLVAYMQSIFDATGSKIPADISAVLVGCVRIISFILLVAIIDKVGRKFLLLISSLGTFISLAALGLYFFLQSSGEDVQSLFWLPVTCLIAFVIFYTLGLGPIPIVLIGELFPQQLKLIAATFIITIGSIVSFTTTLVFPYLVDCIGMGVSIWIFSVCCCLSAIFVIAKVPETKGKSLYEIQKMLNANESKKASLESKDNLGCVH